MKNKERKGLFTKNMWIRICVEGMMIGSLALLAFAVGNILSVGQESLSVGRTMAFCVLSLSQLVHAFNMRSEHSIFKEGVFANKYLIYALFAGIILQAGVVTVPALASIFKVTPLNSVQWAITAVLSLMPIFIVELDKLWFVKDENLKKQRTEKVQKSILKS